MGMFDSVIAKCPVCSTNIEFQSKARGNYCTLREYKVNKVPTSIALDLDGKVETCSACRANVVIKALTVPVTIIMGVEEVIEELD